MALNVSADAASPDVVPVLRAMAASKLLRFRDWEQLQSRLPAEPGVYTIWQGTRLLYAGSAVGSEGLRGRLRRHATGNRVSSDFCRYAWHKDVLPGLDPREAKALEPQLANRLIHEHMRRRYAFRVAITATSAMARRAETALRDGALHPGPTLRPPLFNPLRKDGPADPASRKGKPFAASDPARVWATVRRWREADGARKSMLPKSQTQVAANLNALAVAPETLDALERAGIQEVVTAVTGRGTPPWLRELRKQQGLPGHYGREFSGVNGVAVAVVWAASRNVR